MAVTVRIPAALRRLTADEGCVAVPAGTVAAILAELRARYPAMATRLMDEQGRLRRFVNIYVNQEDIRCLSGEETVLAEGDELSIIPAIAGG